jgi:dihydroorotate dehydrogenase (fumarate)/dihydroorotate dehydrogenase
MMNLYADMLRPLLFRFDAERVHDCAISTGAMAGALPPARRLLSAKYRFDDPRLRTDVCGVDFANPIGLAAGFDKNGRAIRTLACLGFGFLEIGSVSALPSKGNPRPRLWRLPKDEAIVVNYGLPNDGARAIARRLSDWTGPVPLGINIVKTNHGPDAPPDTDNEIIADYVESVRVLEPCADYLCLNLSCPNTGTGRDFFRDPANTSRLLTALSELNIQRPLFLKVSPLGGVEAIEGLLEAVEGAGFVSGFMFNLAPGKPPGLRTDSRRWRDLPGSLSGRPVEPQLNEALRELYTRMDRQRYRIIGVGGVFSADDAYLKIRLGASLVELLTALIFLGPRVVRSICEGLCRLLDRDGLKSVNEATGVLVK